MVCLIICMHLRGIASMMLINLKCSVGEGFAFNTLTSFRKIPLQTLHLCNVITTTHYNNSFLLNPFITNMISILHVFICAIHTTNVSTSSKITVPLIVQTTIPVVIHKKLSTQTATNKSPKHNQTAKRICQHYDFQP